MAARRRRRCSRHAPAASAPAPSADSDDHDVDGGGGGVGEGADARGCCPAPWEPVRSGLAQTGWAGRRATAVAGGLALLYLLPNITWAMSLEVPPAPPQTNPNTPGCFT